MDIYRIGTIERNDYIAFWLKDDEGKPEQAIARVNSNGMVIETSFSMGYKLPVMLVKSKGKYHKDHDRIALYIASCYGMTREYKEARQHGLSPIEALEEWDLIKPEDYKLFEE